MKGLKLRTVIGLFCLVLTLAGVLVAHVWKQNAYVRLSMSTVRIEKQQNQLRNDIALLEVSVAGLKKLSRIEAMAKARFGLEYGKTPVLVYLDGAESRAREPRGREASGEPAVPAPNNLSVRAEPAASPSEDGKGLVAGKVAWRTSGL